MRTVRIVCLSLLLALLAPATASAQAPPPDERAAAQGLADAGQRLIAADREIGEDHDPDDGLDAPRCHREIYRIPLRRQDALRAFAMRDEFRKSGDALEPALAAFRTEIANVQTRDPALISGRAAWRRLAKAYMALPPRGDVCADLAAWRRDGLSAADGASRHRGVAQRLRRVRPRLRAQGRGGRGPDARARGLRGGREGLRGRRVSAYPSALS